MTDRRTPNILLIVTDDHGYADRSVLGIHEGAITPSLDRLAAEGVTCEQAYSTAPICSPARGALITGRYPYAAGIEWFDSAHLPEDRVTLAQYLSEQGYATGHFGKIHYGHEKPGDHGCPQNHGFQESLYGITAMGMGRMHYLHRGAALAEAGGEAAMRHGLYPLYEGDTPVEPAGFVTDLVADRAADFIAGHRDEPFFCSVAFNAPHNFCWQLPEEELAKRGLPVTEDWSPDSGESYYDWYDRSITPNLAHGRDYYLAQVELMDAAVGRLLDHLDTLGLAEDTIVLYTADHGGSTCNYGDNTPLRLGKYTLWEGGIRIHYLVRWPGGGIPAGSRTRALVSHLDVFPSVVAAVGGQAPEGLHGHDQLAVWRGESEQGHGELHWDVGYSWAVRRGDHKLLHIDGDSVTAKEIIHYEHTDPGDGTHLHDLEADLSETRDLAAEHPELVAELTDRHQRWRADVRAS